jgi:hypothetical protein
VTCFVGGSLRTPGEVFEVNSSFKSKHVAPVDGKEVKAPKAKPAAAEPTTLSEMNKAGASNLI